MASVKTILCTVCKKKKQAINSNTICTECSQLAKYRAENEYFQRLDNLSVEERLRKLEIEVYEHKKVKHITDHLRY